MSIDGPRCAPHLAMIGKLSPFPRTWGDGRQAFVSTDQGAALERITELVAEKPKGPRRSPHPLALRFEVLQADDLRAELCRHADLRRGTTQSVDGKARLVRQERG